MSSDTENIFIVYLGEDDDDQQDNDDATWEPSAYPTPVPPEREADFRECPPRPEDDTAIEYDSNNPPAAAELWGVAPIDFVYSIELTATTSNQDDDDGIATLTEEGENALMISLSQAMMDSIYENECGYSITPVEDDNKEIDISNRDLGYRRHHQRGRRLGSGDANVVARSRGLGRSQRRQLGIQSISPGSGHQIIGRCPSDGDEGQNGESLEDSNSNSTAAPTNMTAFDYTLPSCAQVGGLVLIGFDTVGEKASSFYSVGNTIIDRIQDDMANGIYLDQVNRDMEPFDVQVSSIKYGHSRYFDKVDQGVFAPLQSSDWEQQHSELSTFSKITIPLIVLLFLLMSCFCWCSYSEYAKMLRKRFAVVIYGDGHYDSDDYSEGNSHFEPYRKPKVVETLHQVEAQPNNLSRKSSYMDVGHCNRPECKLCRHQSNYRAVSMIGELSKDLGGDEDATCLDAQSLETTFQDLNEIQRKGYQGGPEEDSPIKAYSTVAHRSRSPFSLSATRSPSLIRIVGEDKHNKDGFYNEPEMVSFVKVDSLIHKKPNGNRRSSKPLRDAPKAPMSPTSPWGFFSSMFGRNQAENDNTAAFPDFVCDPRGMNFEEVDPDDRSDDDLDFKSIPVPRSATMYTYAPSTSSKLEASRTAWSLPTSWMSPFTSTNDQENAGNDGKGDASTFCNDTETQIKRQHSMEDSIVMRNPEWAEAYNNNSSSQNKSNAINAIRPSTAKKNKPRIFKMRKQRSMDALPQVPVGRKRTLTDDRGRVRQEVSL